MDFDSKLLNTLEKIGFRKKTSSRDISEYAYYPDYLDDKHYTMIIVIHGDIDKKNSTNGYGMILGKIDYRLYIHNFDGSYNKSPFQVSSFSDWDRNFLTEKINKIFIQELRQIKLNNLLLNV